MGKLFSVVKHLSIGILWAAILAASILVINLCVPQYANAAPALDRGGEEMIQPFELTNPAATREEAYDEIAELNKDPKALIKAENKEEKAQEELLKEEAKGLKVSKK